MSGLVPPIDFPQLHGKPGTPGPPGTPGAAGPAGPAGANGNALVFSVDVADVMAMTTNNGKDIISGSAGMIIRPISAILSCISTSGNNTAAPQIALRYAGSNSAAGTNDMATGANSIPATNVVGCAGVNSALPVQCVGAALRAVNSSAALNGTWVGTARLTVWYQIASAT